MFKIINNLTKYYLIKKSVIFLLLFFIFSIKNLYSVEKIYLDLANIKFVNEINYKNHETSSQLLIKTNLDKEIKEWANNNIILKGKNGLITIKILDESIIDNFVEKHRRKFSFLPRDGIAYKINFKLKVIAENKKNNSRAEVLSIVKGEKTFLGSFSINDRSNAIDELMNNMINRLKNNLEKSMSKEFKDFLTNKYN